MSQHDYNIANGGGAAVRADINNAMLAVLSQNSGATAPTTTKPFMMWYDTTTGVLKMRNAADTAWVDAITGVSGGNGLGMVNRVINGRMEIDQRNAGASVTPAAGSYTLDRWAGASTQASKFTVQQSTDVPSGFKNSLKVTSSSAYSVTGNDYFGVYQPIEGYNVSDLGFGAAGAASVTLSFWVKSSLTGSFGGSIQNGTQDRCYSFAYTVNAANTWEYKTVTAVGDTNGTWNTDNTKGMIAWFGLGATGTRVGTAGAWGTQSGAGLQPSSTVSVVGTSGATFYITGVDLRKGTFTSAPAWDWRPYGTELALCQRYFETSYELGTAVGSVTYNGATFFQVSSTTTTLFNSQRPFAVTKRATPTMAYYNPATGASGSIRDMSSNANFTVSSNFNSATTSTGAVVTSASITANYQHGAHWTASSEL